MTDIFTCFGYGSLVNRRTLPEHAELRRVRVRGWRRAWRLAGESSFGRRCTLTVVTDPDSEIAGVVVAQKHEGREDLDRREKHYDPHVIEPADLTWIDGQPDRWPEPFIFVSKPEHTRQGDDDHPVYLSYIDVVISGFMDQFGEDGARHFVETTLDWHVPVVNDRANPRYARSLELSRHDHDLCDRILGEAGVELRPDSR